MKRLFLLVCLVNAINSSVFTSGAMSQTEMTTLARASQTVTVEVFVTSWCQYCRKLEAFLKENQIRYTRYDVEADAKGAAIFQKLGGTGIPVTRVGSVVIHGYDPGRIVAALKKRS
jgi:glutaredoxin